MILAHGNTACILNVFSRLPRHACQSCIDSSCEIKQSTSSAASSCLDHLSSTVLYVGGAAPNNTLANAD